MPNQWTEKKFKYQFETKKYKYQSKKNWTNLNTNYILNPYFIIEYEMKMETDHQFGFQVFQIIKWLKILFTFFSILNQIKSQLKKESYPIISNHLYTIYIEPERKLQNQSLTFLSSLMLLIYFSLKMYRQDDVIVNHVFLLLVNLTVFLNTHKSFLFKY